MNALQQEINNNLLIWDRLGMGCFKEHPEGTPDEPIRAYLCSKNLGGTLAGYGTSGWIPIYPNRPNYPLMGSWYSPIGVGKWKESMWQTAVLAALDPQTYLSDINEVGKRTAIDRATKLRDPFRAQIVIAIIKGVK